MPVIYTNYLSGFITKLTLNWASMFITKLFLNRARKIPWRRKWQLTPVFLSGKSYGRRNLAVHGPSGHKRVGHNLATKQQLWFLFFFMIHTFFLHFFVSILSVYMCVLVFLCVCVCVHCFLD